MTPSRGAPFLPTESNTRPWRLAHSQHGHSAPALIHETGLKIRSRSSLSLQLTPCRHPLVCHSSRALLRRLLVSKSAHRCTPCPSAGASPPSPIPPRPARSHPCTPSIDSTAPSFPSPSLQEMTGTSPSPALSSAAKLGGGAWDTDTQEVHGGQTWQLCGDAFVEDFSVTTNALGAPAAALTAARDALDRVHHYPPADCAKALAHLSEFMGKWPTDQLLLGNGASEFIDLVMRVATREGGGAYRAGPFEAAYREYDRAATAADRPTYSWHQVQRGLPDGHRIGVTVIIHPNSPTGDFTPLDQLEAWIRQRQLATPFRAGAGGAVSGACAGDSLLDQTVVVPGPAAGLGGRVTRLDTHPETIADAVELQHAGAGVLRGRRQGQGLHAEHLAAAAAVEAAPGAVAARIPVALGGERIQPRVGALGVRGLRRRAGGRARPRRRPARRLPGAVVSFVRPAAVFAPGRALARTPGCVDGGVAARVCPRWRRGGRRAPSPRG
eukprot:ctg_1014.g327